MDFHRLYRKYADELYSLGHTLREQYHDLLSRGFRATFGDVEGELLYMLLRETRPEVVFEISPDCGWSTNYILAALTRNRTGTVHSFELAERLNGAPVEQAIRANIGPEWDQRRLVLHIGDARETTARVPGPIQFLFLDSCHEAFFAEWYVARLFPRVRGMALIQDIAFADELEPSGEARFVWDWLAAASPETHLVGAIEQTLRPDRARLGLPERRGLRSNSVVFELPIRRQADRPCLAEGPRDLLVRAESAVAAGQRIQADQLLNRAVATVLVEPTFVHRHRLLVQAARLYQRLGDGPEAGRCYQRALGCAVQGDKFQRIKGLAELTRLYRRDRRWRLASAAWALRLCDALGALVRRRTRRPESAVSLADGDSATHLQHKAA
jgi:predicted O-methyltransferase YrrM